MAVPDHRQGFDNRQTLRTVERAVSVPVRQAGVPYKTHWFRFAIDAADETDQYHGDFWA
jgi:hypothetical protein